MRFHRELVIAAALTVLEASRVQAAPNASAAAAGLAVAAPARGSTLVAWKSRAWAPAAAMLTTVGGLRVAIDPLDGTLGMPAAATLSPQVGIAEDAPLRLTLRPDGSGRAQLDERWADFAVVSLDAHGVPVWACVHGSSGAAHFSRQALWPCPSAISPEAVPRVEK